MLDTGELMWTPMSQTPLVPQRTCDDWGWSDPGTSSRHPLSEGRPLLAFSGSMRGPVEVSSQVAWIVCGRLPLRVYRGLGPVRASVHLSWVLAGAGVTPAVHLHGPAPSATPHHYPHSARLARTLRTFCNIGCGTCVVGGSLHWGPPCSDDPVSNSAVTGALVAGCT